MTCAGGNKVADKESVEEDTLGAKDHDAHESSWLAEFKEGEKVHALVVGFLDEGFDPAVISTEAAEGVKVANHTADHSGDAGDGLEKDEADKPLFGGHGEDLVRGVGGVAVAFRELKGG